MDIMSIALFAIAPCAVAFAARPKAFALLSVVSSGYKAGNTAVEGTSGFFFGNSHLERTCGNATTVLSSTLVDRTRTTSDVVSTLGRPLS